MSALDFVARGQVARLAALDRRRRTFELLAQSIRGGGFRQLMSIPPTIGTPSAASAISGTYFSSVTYPQLYTTLRGEWPLFSDTYPGTSLRKCVAVHGNSAGSTNGGTNSLIRFHTDAPDFEIMTRGTSEGYHLSIEGELVQASRLTNLVGIDPFAYTRVTFGDGSASYRQMRLIEIEGAASFGFGGIKVPATSKIWPAPLARGADLRVIVHGDSFTERLTDFPDLLGQRDTRASGLGGTGFIEDAGGTKYTFIERVQADVIDPAPDVIIELGGVNDLSDTAGNAALEQAAVGAWLDAVQAALPEVPIFMTGPMSPNDGGNGSWASAVRDGKQAACAGRPNVFFIDNIAELWVTGTGKSGSPAGNGNADWVTDIDGTHPTSDGRKYLAQRVVHAMLRHLEGTGAAGPY